MDDRVRVGTPEKVHPFEFLNGVHSCGVRHSPTFEHLLVVAGAVNDGTRKPMVEVLVGLDDMVRGGRGVPVPVRSTIPVAAILFSECSPEEDPHYIEAPSRSASRDARDVVVPHW